MDALQAAQSVYDSTIRNLANKEIELDVSTSLQVATFCAALATAEQLAHIAMHLGNIHQTLMTPDANREPATVADMLKRIADALYANNGTLSVTELISGIEENMRMP